MLHLVLAEIISGVEAMEGKNKIWIDAPAPGR